MWHVDPIFGQRQRNNQWPLLGNGSVNKAVGKQWMSRTHVGKLTGANATLLQKYRNGVLCVVRFEYYNQNKLVRS
jgi:hypothetical protein